MHKNENKENKDKMEISEEENSQVKSSRKAKIKSRAQKGIVRIIAIIAVASMLMATCGTLIYYLMNM